MRRTLLFFVVIALINAVQVFEPVALITQGGPVGSTNVLTYHIRRVGIERAQGGLGSAMAVTLMLALMVAVGLRVRPLATGRRVVSVALAPRTARSRRPAGAPMRWSLPNWRRVLAGAVVLVCCVVAAFPLAWMVLTSLKTAARDDAVAAGVVPAPPVLDAYARWPTVIDVPPVVPQLGDHRDHHHRRHPAAPA